MPRTNTVVDFSSGSPEIKVVAMSASEEARIDAEEAQYVAEKPMKEWKLKIAETDAGMPRYLEDLITDNSNLIIHEKMKTRYDEKITLRATKP